MAKMGENDYRIGARERLAEAYVLLRRARLGGSIYLAGRAVEGMLRAVIWRSDSDYAKGRKSLETGHDLIQLLSAAANLGALSGAGLRDAVQRIGRMWSNDLRFSPQRRIETRWVELGEVRGKQTFKKTAGEFCGLCGSIMRRCEAIWQR